MLCATIVRDAAGARVPLRRADRRRSAIALAGSAVGAVACRALDGGSSRAWQRSQRQEIFTGMLVYDSFTVYFRAVPAAVRRAVRRSSRELSGIPDRDDGPDFYSLVLGATLGMCLMASANHLLTVFLGVEMASVPSYVLAGMLKGRRASSEAALKYAVYGAGAAGVMLYGISLLAGVLGIGPPADDGRAAGRHVRTAGVQRRSLMVLALGGLMIMVGLAFKLSAVPFHFWCPDVFEGATAEVNAFLSVASKAAALALLVRVALGLGTMSPEQAVSRRRRRPRMRRGRAPPTRPPRMFNVADEPAAATAAPTPTRRRRAASDQIAAGARPHVHRPS